MITGYRMIVTEHGGPDKVSRETFEVPSPGPGEILIETEAVGLNFIDTYLRSGLYPSPLPTVLGSESVGTIVALGDGVREFSLGDRIGFTGTGGAYTTHRIVPAAGAIRIPSGIDPQIAAAVLLKGLTAAYLAEETYPSRAGDIALVHAAAGGVGSLLVPWLTEKGVTVIAHCGSAEKARTVPVPASHSLFGDYADLAPAVRALTEGAMCHVVYDGVGAASWQASLACLRSRGMMASYGNASGAVPPFSIFDLMQSGGGSLYVTRPILGHYIATPEARDDLSGKLFERIAQGILKPSIGQTFLLSEAADAHRALEARATTGSTVLIP